MLESEIRCLSDETKNSHTSAKARIKGSLRKYATVILSIQNCRMAKNAGQPTDNSSGGLSPYGCPLGCSYGCTAAEWRSIWTRVRSPSRWIADALLAACEQLLGLCRWLLTRLERRVSFPLHVCLRRRRGGLHRGEKCSASGGFKIGQPP